MLPVISLFSFNNSGTSRMSVRQLSIFLLLLNRSDCLSLPDWWEKNTSDPGRCLQIRVEFLFSFWTTWPILLIECPQSSVEDPVVALFPPSQEEARPLCCIQGAHPAVALTPPPLLPQDRALSFSSAPGLGLPGTCQELKVVFFLPQEIIFLGMAAPGCQSLAFTKAHVCVTVALLLGVL